MRAIGGDKRFGLAENAAEGKRRRLRERRPTPVHIDSAAQVEALQEAATELDRDPHYDLVEREAIVATLLFSGPRAHELCNLLWRDVDLANGRLFIGRSKTPAGLREIRMLPVLRDILAAYKATAYRGDPDDLVFPTLTGSAATPTTCAAASSLPSYGAPTSCWSAAAWCRSRAGSPATSCDTPSPRSSSPAARTRSR